MKRLPTILFTAFVSVFISVFILGCSPPTTPTSRAAPPTGATKKTIRGHAMGTTWTVVLASHTKDERALHRQCEETLEALEAHLSHWREESALSQFNRHPAAQPIEISPELAAIVEEAQEVHRLSRGAFDITAAALVDLWGFGPAGRNAKSPSESGTPNAKQIEQTMAQIGMHQLELTQPTVGHFRLLKKRANVSLDLSALAKGYAIDVLAENLKTQGVENYLIEFGGELRAHGQKNDGQPWRVGLEQPSPSLIRTLRKTITLNNAAIATSGSYRNFVRAKDTNGKSSTHSHLIDPRTGSPIKHDLVSVSVVAETAMRADAWATALMVLGPEEGFDLAEERGLQATFLIQSPAGTTSERETTTFAK